MNTVINLKGRRDDPQFDPALNTDVIYCGRNAWWGRGRKLTGHPLANRFSVSKYGRDAALGFYRQWLASVPNLEELLAELRGKTLGCWCHPLPCHCDVISEELDKRWGGSS
jgi:hypothetical protein